MRISLFSAALFVSSATFAATPVDGLYTRVFGGYTYLPNNVSTTINNNAWTAAAYGNGYHAGASFGYQSNPLRYEFEYTYLSADTRQFRINFIEQTGVNGQVSANWLMANVFYDLPEVLPSIVPYLGIGVGYASLQTTLNGTGPNGYTAFKATGNEFAYQATAGLTYNFAENYGANISYRYAMTNSAYEFGKIFQANMASAGVIYHFDKGNYK